MKKKIFPFILLLPCVVARAQHYWQQEVNYTIDVSLNDSENSLNGFTRIQYINHSPDTLHYLWFHLWPNAYKNDQTAFSDQLLKNNRTDFYFSDEEQRGYINRLDFRVDGIIAVTEDHPEFIDIVKLILPQPLAPGDSIQISTPFYEKLPLNFSRGGHLGQSYQITQWYPKPAVYDQQGWHPMPYLDQGEFYAEFGNYDVRIRVPKNYVVAATGKLQNKEEMEWMLNRKPEAVNQNQKPNPNVQGPKPKAGMAAHKKQPASRPSSANTEPADTATKTMRYIQDHIHDFAWFADKQFMVDHDTVQLRSGKIIDAYAFYKPEDAEPWKNSTASIKAAVHFYSGLVGDYPFSVVTAVDAGMGVAGGMEYPTICAISSVKNEKLLDLIICHEVGHNWFYAAIGSNERRYPWMDEGINSYYEQRYEKWKYKDQLHDAHVPGHHIKWLANKMPADEDKLLLDILIKEKRDQPIATASADFNEINYNLIPYTKTALWMQQLEDSLGTPLFDTCMHAYFRKWQFRHPYPGDFRTVMEKTSGRKLQGEFALLDQKGPLPATREQKKIKPAFLFSLHQRDQFNYINLAPGIGYNNYDKFMIGAVLNNFNLPENNFEFLLVPLYATGSRRLNGLADISYSWHPANAVREMRIGINYERFSTNASTDTSGNKVFEGFSKTVPYIRFSFKNKTALSSLEKWIDFRTYIINERTFSNYMLSPVDSNIHAVASKTSSRYLNELSFNLRDHRVLYPYNVQVQFQQSNIFYRINFNGNYFFNYAHGGGMALRLFAAKFGTWGNDPGLDAQRYEPKLLAVTGEEDYTYSNYFLGRSASYAIENVPIKNNGLAAQQVMIRDGGLKLRIDQYDFVQGRSANWVSALNFSSTLPNHLFPFPLPLKIFFDIGTYAEAWNNNSPTSRFLYVGGIQLSLVHDLLNIYIPVLYSSDFSDLLKTLPEQNSFWKRITFSIDIQHFDHKKNIADMFAH